MAGALSKIMNACDGVRPAMLKKMPIPLARVVMSLAVFALALLASQPAANAWGPTAHRLTNRWAVETLPPEIRGFFDANRSYLIEHANDADALMVKDLFERNRHYIYLDKYGIFPYPKLPHSFKLATEQYGKSRINRDGLLPWQVGEYSLRLTNALKAQNWDEVRLDAAMLGHYVADATDPLHTTQNYDGQLTGQAGLLDRFEIRLIDRFSNFFMLAPQDAVKIDDPTEFAFQLALDAHTWVDRIVLEDRRSLEGLPSYNEDYFNRFYSQIGTTVMQQINAAAHAVGSYWYTAWLNAGRPTLPSR
jgi:hypothetical protein